MSDSIDDETKYLRLMIAAHICPSHPQLKDYNIEKLKNDYFQSYGRGHHYSPVEQFYFFENGLERDMTEKIMNEIIKRFNSNRMNSSVHCFPNR